MEQFSVAPGQTILLKIIKKDNSERVIQVKMGSKADVTTQPTLEQSTANASSEKTTAPIEPVNAGPNVEPPNGEVKPEEKLGAKAESKTDGSTGWVVALIAIFGALTYYLKQEKNKNAKKTGGEGAKTKSPATNPNINKSATKEASIPEPEKIVEPPKKPSKEELLKQQQLNAFKKLK